MSYFFRKRSSDTRPASAPPAVQSSSKRKTPSPLSSPGRTPSPNSSNSGEESFSHRAQQEQVSNDDGLTWGSLADHVRALGIDVGSCPAPNELEGSDGWKKLEENGLFVRVPFGDLSTKASSLLAPFLHPDEHDKGSLLHRTQLEEIELKNLRALLDDPWRFFGRPWSMVLDRGESEFRRKFNEVVERIFGPGVDFFFREKKKSEVPYACVPGHRQTLPDLAVYLKDAQSFGHPDFSPACLVGEYKGDVDPATAEPQLAMDLAAQAVMLRSVGIPSDEICVIGFALGAWRIIFSAMTFRVHPDDPRRLQLVYTRVLSCVPYDLESRQVATAVGCLLIAVKRSTVHMRALLQDHATFKLMAATDEYDDDYDFSDPEDLAAPAYDSAETLVSPRADTLGPKHAELIERLERFAASDMESS